MNAELLIDARCELGEGPIWDASRARLWWTDIDGRLVWRFDPVSRRTERFAPPDRVGFLAAAADGRVLLGCAKALYMAEIAGDALKTTKLVDVEANLSRTRVNDGRVDRAGGVVFGTMDEERPRTPIGSFYHYSRAHGLRRLDLPSCAVANSICFSPDGGTMYFADTPTGTIRRGDYDARAATIANVRDFVTIAPADGHPDGSIVDGDGCVWNAAWGGSIVRRYTPDGRLDRTVGIPTKNPTCPAFGGGDLATMFVTSSRQQLTAEELTAGPHAGGVFSARLEGVRGLPERPFVP